MVLIHIMGNDPGSVNFAVCDLSLNGMVYTENFEEEIPNVQIHNWELWNLKTRWGIRRKQGTNVFERYHLGKRESPPNPLEKDQAEDTRDNIALWLSNMNYFVFHNEWLRKNRTPNGQLATLAIENQFDHIQSFGTRTDMHTISNTFASSIGMSDIERSGRKRSPVEMGEEEKAPSGTARLIIKRALKYGVPHDGSLNYDQRKAEGIKVTLKLLEVLGFTEWLGFLQTVLASGQKIDDLCDAFLLALQAAVDLNTKLVKDELPENVPRVLLSATQRAAASSQPIETITFPVIEVEDMPLKRPINRGKKKTTTTPVISVTNNTKKRKAAIDDEASVKRRKENLSFENHATLASSKPIVFPAMLLPSSNNNTPTKKRQSTPKCKSKPVALSIEIFDDDIEECAF